MKTRSRQIFFRVFAVALCLLTAWINFNALSEAYGSGPPYFSQTTNMDKWSDPLPYIIPADIVVLLVAWLAFRFPLKST